MRLLHAANLSSNNAKLASLASLCVKNLSMIFNSAITPLYTVFSHLHMYANLHGYLMIFAGDLSEFSNLPLLWSL